jgi:hypothetical protein
VILLGVQVIIAENKRWIERGEEREREREREREGARTAWH